MAMSTDALHLRTMKLKQFLDHYLEDLRELKPQGPWQKGKVAEVELHLATAVELEARVRAALVKKGGQPHEG